MVPIWRIHLTTAITSSKATPEVVTWPIPFSMDSQYPVETPTGKTSGAMAGAFEPVALTQHCEIAPLQATRRNGVVPGILPAVIGPPRFGIANFRATGPVKKGGLSAMRGR